MIADFEARVGTPIDFHQDGYLFLLSASNVRRSRKMALQRHTASIDGSPPPKPNSSRRADVEGCAARPPAPPTASPIPTA